MLQVQPEKMHERKLAANALVHHSDKGSQYLSIRYTERLAEAGIQPSVGSRDDSYDNAPAETIDGAVQGRVDSPPGTLEK